LKVENPSVSPVDFANNKAEIVQFEKEEAENITVKDFLPLHLKSIDWA